MLMLISASGVWGMRCSGPRLRRTRLASFCLGTSPEHAPRPAWWSAYWESRVRGTSLHPPSLMHVGQRSKLDPDTVQSVRQLPALMLPRMHGVVMTLTFGSTACSSQQMTFLTFKTRINLCFDASCCVDVGLDVGPACLNFRQRLIWEFFF